MRRPHVLVDVAGHVAVVTLNRPAVANALSAEMLVRLDDIWRDVDREGDVRAVVLTGAGGHFCAGADLDPEIDDEGWATLLGAEPALYGRAVLRDRVPAKPVIAAVEGRAVGAGTELVLGTDVRVAGESACFGIPAPRWGLPPVGGATVRLPRQARRTHALDLLLTGREAGAAEALRMGLIGRVVRDGRAVDAALEVAERIAANGPVAVQAIRRAVRDSEVLSERRALALEWELGRAVYASGDAQEGVRALEEHRPPQFEGD